MKWLKDEKPLWVITNSTENDAQLTDILQEEYELKNESVLLHVYRLKEQ